MRNKHTTFKNVVRYNQTRDWCNLNTRENKRKKEIYFLSSVGLNLHVSDLKSANLTY